MKYRLALLAALTAFGADPVRSAGLSADNWAMLCTARHEGKPAVDADRLASAILAEAGATLLIDGANPQGDVDGMIQLRSSATLPSEPAYLILNLDTPRAANDNRPFLADNPSATRMRAGVVAQLADMALMIATRSRAGGPNRTYRLVERTGIGVPRNTGDATNPMLLFGLNPVYAILCETAPSSSLPPPRVATSEPDEPRRQLPSDIVVTPLLRGTVAALHVRSDPQSLANAKPATISYERNEVANTETFRLNGIVGLRIGNRAGTFGAIPYLSYERSVVTGAGDVEKLSPGLLLAHYLERPTFALHSRLEASFIDDLEQGSHQGKLRIYLDPAFALAGGGVLFGTYLRVSDTVYLRPELTLIADASRVFRAGTSTALANADDYFGIGGDLALRARVELGPLSAFSFGGGVRELVMFGEIDQDHIRRWYGSIEFAPPNWPYFGLAFTFTNGENDDTLQREEKYGLSFTFRY